MIANKLGKFGLLWLVLADNMKKKLLRENIAWHWLKVFSEVKDIPAVLLEQFSKWKQK